jgi:hypothetical protein
VKTARQLGWDQLKNGEMIAKAAAQFDVFLTIDKKLQFELNLATLPIAIVILDSPSNAFAELVAFGPHLQSLLSNPLARALHVIRTDGRVDRL